MRTLSIRQPWAWLIVNGHKSVENRDWATLWRGEFLVHASSSGTKKAHAEIAAQVHDLIGLAVPEFDALPRGGIVGITRIVHCVYGPRVPRAAGCRPDYEVLDTVDERWFTDGYGFVLADSRPLPFHACKGRLGFFEVPLSAIETTPTGASA